MRKGYKRRRGLIAMAAAFVLVVLLSIPALAVDSSATPYNVYIDGTFYMQPDTVLSTYFTISTAYAVDEGTMSLYRENGTLIGSGYTELCVDTGEHYNTTGVSYLGVIEDDDNHREALCSSTDSTYATAKFSAYSGRYIVFNHCLVSSDSEIYAFVMGAAALTSRITLTSEAGVSSDITSIIVDGFNGIITGLGSGVADFFQTLFMANDGTGNLSTFAIVSLVFIGVAVAFGIARWIIKKVGQ